jgi:hypothetical protein
MRTRYGTARLAAYCSASSNAPENSIHWGNKMYVPVKEQYGWPLSKGLLIHRIVRYLDEWYISKRRIHRSRSERSAPATTKRAVQLRSRKGVQDVPCAQLFSVSSLDADIPSFTSCCISRSVLQGDYAGPGAADETER